MASKHGIQQKCNYMNVEKSYWTLLFEKPASQPSRLLKNNLELIDFNLIKTHAAELLLSEQISQSTSKIKEFVISNEEMSKLALQAEFFHAIITKSYKETNFGKIIMHNISFETFFSLYSTADVNSEVFIQLHLEDLMTWTKASQQDDVINAYSPPRPLLLELIEKADYLNWKEKFIKFSSILAKIIDVLPKDEAGFITTINILHDIPMCRHTLVNTSLSKYLGTYITLHADNDLSDCIDLLNEVLLEELIIEKPLKILRQIKSLTSIVVTNNKVTDEDLKHLLEMPLKSINLSQCTEISDQGLALLKARPLESLYLSGCCKITDVGLRHLKDMPLKNLNLDLCKQITDVGLAHLEGMPLETLYLDFCEKITELGCSFLSKAPLKKLSMCFCTAMTDKSIRYLQKMPLQVLYLSAWKNLTDQGLQDLQGLPLKLLNLTWCTNITNEGLSYLAKLPFLTDLYINNCRKITLAGIAGLQGMSSSLKMVAHD